MPHRLIGHFCLTHVHVKISSSTKDLHDDINFIYFAALTHPAGLSKDLMQRYCTMQVEG